MSDTPIYDELVKDGGFNPAVKHSLTPPERKTPPRKRATIKGKRDAAKTV